MSVLLVNPFLYDFTAFDFWAKPRGLMEVAGLFQQLGFTVDFIDCLYPQDAGMKTFIQNHADIVPPKSKRFGTGTYYHEEIPKPEWARSLPRRFYRYGYHPDFLRERLRQIQVPPALIGLTGIMTYWYPGIRDSIQIIKEIFPNTPVILGGIYPTLMPAHARTHSGADYVFTGRASATRLRLLLSQIGLGCPLDDAASQRLIDQRPPLFYPYAQPAYGITALSEGCRARCSYCACSTLYPDWRSLDLERSLAEVQQVISLGCRDIAFYDDDLLLDFEHVLLPFLERSRAMSAQLRFHAANGLALRRVNMDRAQILKQYGFTTLRFGFETADEELSQRIGHKISAKDFKERISGLHAAGFTTDQIGVYVLIGLPGQSVKQVEDSIHFVQDCGGRVHLCEFSPVPGTVEYQKAADEAGVDYDREPLLQNNSLLPLRSSTFSWEIINRLKNRCN